MGFITGFTGGVTLTLGLAYLTVLAHERNRRAQADSLPSQSRVLNGLFEQHALPLSQSRRPEVAREERSSFVETGKDRWNEEVVNAVRWAQRQDWTEMRESIEGAAARLLGSGLQKSREGIEQAEKQAGPKVHDGGFKVAVAQDVAKITADRTLASAKMAENGAVDAVKSSGGTADAARGALKGVVSKGIEKGKEALENVQAAAGLATENIESKESAALRQTSAVEKAIQARYEMPNVLDKTVEQVLAERYKAIDTGDNTL